MGMGFVWTTFVVMVRGFFLSRFEAWKNLFER